MSYFDNYTEEEIKNIISHSTSLKDFAYKIGYSHTPSGDTIKYLKEKLSKYDTSHFNKIKKSIIRNEDNIFIENSTAE